MDVEEQITLYLREDDLLFKSWYLKQTQHEAGIDFGEPVSTLQDYRNAFNKWVEFHKKTLKKRICPHFDEIKKLKRPVDAILFIISLIEDLAIVGGVVQVATALFNYGIEKLCGTNESGKH